MKIYQHICQAPNLGDEINNWFWERVFGDSIFDNDGSELFVGIGTILNNRLPSTDKLHIFGAGAGYGDHVPNQILDSWTVYCVRGPLTARQLGLSPDYAVCDPAVLLPEVHPLSPEENIDVAFMPHVGIDSLKYRELVESLGICYLSPSEDSFSLIEKIASTKYLVTSAMHGAIIADAYRVPWAPVITSPEILRFKWEDWLTTMDMNYIATSLPSYWLYEEDWVSKLKRTVKENSIRRAFDRLLKERPQFLSDDRVLRMRQEQLLNKAEAFKRHI